MKIQSVAILGAGAVGSYIIWGLSKKDNIRLGVIAEGDRARRLKESGCAINGAVYRPEVWTPQEAQGVDLLVVALKYGSLPGALESIKTAVGSNTVVMSLMNGVDSEELIAAQVGAEHLLYSFIKVTSHKEADGYHFDPDATLGVIYGERFAPFENERVQAVRELFTDSRVNFRVTEHIQEEMWSKPLQLHGALICALQMPSATDALFLPRPVIPLCRIWMPDGIQRSICSRER